MVPTWTGFDFTSTGNVRSLNEDAVLNCTSQHLWAVADGMGGHEDGDYASQMVVRELSKYRFSRSRGVAIGRINEALELCNTHLIGKAATERADIIGCTVAALSFHGSQIVCSWSGDSRIYRVRGGSLRQLTRDHSFQSLSDDRDLHTHPEALTGDGQILTSAIGGEDQMRIEHCWYTLDSQDQFLLCTDGLYKEVSNVEILDAMVSHQSAKELVDSLVELYLQRGSRDNIGIVYVNNR